MLSDNIKRIRKSKGLSQEELAIKLNSPLDCTANLLIIQRYAMLKMIRYRHLLRISKGGKPNMKYNLPDRILRELSSFAQKYSVTKIILFGSRARGSNTERSDIDIAVYGGDFDHFYWDVKEKTHSLLMFDIVQADTTISDELKQEIEKDGVTIYEKA